MPAALLAEHGPRIRARDTHRAAGRRLLAGDIDAAPYALWSADDPEFDHALDPHLRRPRIGGPRIGVLPIRDVLFSHAGWCWEGYNSLTAYGRALIAEGADVIVMVIGSPGGACQGLSEFCTEIRAWREAGILVYAALDHEAASAAYAIAAQAETIYITRSSIIGHCGTWTEWYDVTEMLRREGVRHGYIERPVGGDKTFFAGDNTERSAEDQDASRNRVMGPVLEHYFRLFMADIEAGRGDRLTAEDAAATLAMIYPGDGPSGDGRTAIEAGLADGVATYEQLMMALEEGGLPADAEEAA